MPREKLTKRLLDALGGDSPAGKQGQGVLPQREKLVWDSVTRGFGVQVMPSGLKSFVVQYRTKAGRSRRVVLGRFGIMTLEQARISAIEHLLSAAKGGDPVDEVRTRKTVAEVCDWYLEEALSGRLLGRRRRSINPGTLAMDRSRIEQHVRPLLGARHVDALRLPDIERFQSEIMAGKTAKPRGASRGGVTTGGAGVAGRTISMLRAIFGHARRLGLIETNPASGVRIVASERRERRLTAEEIARLGRVLLDLGREGESPAGLAAIRLMLLTGFRRMEALGLQWAWVQDNGKCVHFPDTKTGPQVRVIGRAAAGLIAGQPREEGALFVFPAETGSGHFIGVVRVLERACRRAGLEDVTAHVLRHSFATMAAELGYSELTIAGLLGHAARGITQRYIHLDAALISAADRVSSVIAELLDGAREGLADLPAISYSAGK
jgi:integrase